MRPCRTTTKRRCACSTRTRLTRRISAQSAATSCRRIPWRSRASLRALREFSQRKLSPWMPRRARSLPRRYPDGPAAIPVRLYSTAPTTSRSSPPAPGVPGLRRAARWAGQPSGRLRRERDVSQRADRSRLAPAIRLYHAVANHDFLSGGARGSLSAPLKRRLRWGDIGAARGHPASSLGGGSWMVFRELPGVAAGQITSLLVHGQPLGPLDGTSDVGDGVRVRWRYGRGRKPRRREPCLRKALIKKDISGGRTNVLDGVLNAPADDRQMY